MPGRSPRARPLGVSLAALVLLAGCSLESVAPTPTPAATPASSAAAPTCRLPVAAGSAPVDGNPADGTTGAGGFVQFPDGTFRVDPASLGSYDHVQSKWLPVFGAWVSPDGSQYAYSVNPVGVSGPVTGAIHVVNVASGRERVIRLPSPSNAISFQPEGVYAVGVRPSSGAPPFGLTLVDPVASTFKQITAEGAWSVVEGGSAWGVDLDASIARPPTEVNPANRVRQLDLQTGAVTVAARYPGMNVQVLGVHGGQVIISAANATDYTVARLDGTRLFRGPVSNSNPTFPIVSDGAAIWFSSFSGVVWRYDPGAGLHQAATTPLQSAMVAGVCR